MRRWLFCLLPVLPFVAAGCAQDDEIKSYTVEQPEREMLRMLTAMVVDDDSTWVFKLMGPDAIVTPQEKAFNELIKSVRINEKQNPPIEWTVPAGWKENKGGGEMRYATFRIDAGVRNLEATVALLPRLGGPGEKNSLLDNINRWRGQMKMPAIDAVDVKDSVREQVIAGKKVIFGDLKAPGVYRLPKSDPHAGLKMPPGKLNAAGPRNLPFTFEVPNGWAPTEGPQFSLAAYDIVDGKQRARVTLSKAGGDVVENVNRWREQVGLKKLPRDELKHDMKPLRVAGLEAIYVDVANPRAEQPNNRILGVIADGQWFIKMTGSDTLVGAEKANFERFVKSFQITPQ